MKSFMLVLFALPLASLSADEVRLEWMSQGFFNKTRYYAPKGAKLLTEKPKEIIKAPEGLVNPQYALLEAGPDGSRTSVGLILDQRSPKEAHMWLDANGDGDLTNDPEVKWEPGIRKSGETEIISWQGESKISVNYPDSQKPI